MTDKAMPEAIWHKIDSAGIAHTCWEEIKDATKYTRDDLTRPHQEADQAEALENYKPGEWFHVHTIDQMQAFYLSRLPAIRQAARECGYAIGVHGSTRRDFDLMAVPWRDTPSSRDDLALKIQMAACGFSQSKYAWKQKARGRFAVSFSICWAEWYDMLSAGHIDLSVIDPFQSPPPDERIPGLEEALKAFSWVTSADEGRDDIIIDGRELIALLQAARAHSRRQNQEGKDG